MAKHKIVLINWDDAWSNSELLEMGEAIPKPLQTIDVGIIMHEDNTGILLAREVIYQPECMNLKYQIYIPKGVIRDTRELGEVEL